MTWRTWKALMWSASVPAVVILPIFPLAAPGVFVMAFLLALFLAYPLYLLLSRVSAVNKWSCSAAGALVGAIPGAVMFWPQSAPGTESMSSRGRGADTVYTMIDGLPTAAAWQDLYTMSAISALIGCGAGYVFWYNAIRTPDAKPMAPSGWKKPANDR